MYRSVPLIRPPILYTTSSLKWGEGLYSNMQLVLNISPPPPPPPPPPQKKKKKVLRDRYIHFQSSCLHKNTFTKIAILSVMYHGPCTREISRVCWYFLHKSGSEMTCIVNGDRRQSEVDGKGLVVPCVYIFKGKQKHLERLITCLLN